MRIIESLKTIPDRSTHKLVEPLGSEFLCFPSYLKQEITRRITGLRSQTHTKSVPHAAT